MFRIATFNIEKLDDGPGVEPALDRRIAYLRPQLLRLRADVLCLQEVNAQKPDDKGPRVLAALDALLHGTSYGDFERLSIERPGGKGGADKHNLVILSRFPVIEHEQIRHQLVAPPRHRVVTAAPSEPAPRPVEWDRPFLHGVLALPGQRRLHVLNLHLRAPLAAPVAGQKLAPFVWKSTGGWAEGFFLAAIKRAGQALEARLLVDRLLDSDPEALIAVCGDFNADEYEVPTRILKAAEDDTGNGDLAGRMLIALERSVPPPGRYSVVHHGRPQMLDHILVSRSLFGWYRGTEIHNEDLGDEAQSSRTVRHAPDSFHAPLVAGFVDPRDAP